MPWGLFPVKNEIPLVTVTKDGSLFLEGTVVTGCLQTFWKTRRPADYSGGLPQLSCPVKPLLSSLALLEVRKVGMWSSYFMAPLLSCDPCLSQCWLLEKTPRRGPRGLVGNLPRVACDSYKSVIAFLSKLVQS